MKYLFTEISYYLCCVAYLFILDVNRQNHVFLRTRAQLLLRWLCNVAQLLPKRWVGQFSGKIRTKVRVS